jgi:D-Tyr-tRNAtyr deacylase
VRTGLVALGAFLILSQATNAADMKPRPRPMPKPAATESRTAPPQQQQMLFEEFLEWLRQRRR